MTNFLKIIEAKIKKNIEIEKIKIIDNTHKHKTHKFFDVNKHHLCLYIQSKYLSGLNRQDYGAIPIVNQANQARNMDELAEQDRAKIQQGQGHRPEMVGIQATQPMARNTTQSRLNLDSPTYNNLRPQSQQRDATQQRSYPPDDFYDQVQRLSQEGLENTRNQQ